MPSPQPSHETPQPQPHIKAIGRVLLTRRVSLDPARHRKRDGWVETVRAVTGMEKPRRTIIDIETGARDSYGPSTLAVLEKAYRIKPGSLGDALQGGQLIAEDGEILYSPPNPNDPVPAPDPERFVTEHYQDEITGRVVSMVRDLHKSTEGMSEDAAREMMRYALDAAGEQLRAVTEAYRRGHAQPRSEETDTGDDED